MRVHILVDYLALAGTERQMMLLARGLASEGHNVEYSALWTSGHDVVDLVAQARDDGVLVHDPIAGTPSAAKTLAAIPKIRSRLRNQRPHVLHTAMSSSEVVGLVSKTQLPMPLIVSRRSMVSDRTHSAVRTKIRRLAVRAADHVVSNSKVVMNDAMREDGFDRSKGTVIYNSVAAEAFQQLPPAGLPAPSNSTYRSINIAVPGPSSRLPILVKVANLSERKGHEYLLEAAAILRRNGRPVTLVLVGEGPYRQAIEDQGRRQSLDIRLIGSVPDVRPYLQAADICVQASISEGMPNSVLEAMAQGIPVIATDVGGTAEALNNSGILIPPADPGSMALAVTKLLDNENLRRSLGEQAKEQATTFSTERTVHEYLIVYLKLQDEYNVDHVRWTTQSGS